MINFENVSVGYNGRALVKGIQLHIKEGTILGVLGPNGSGKSTVVKTLTGRLAPVAGRITLGGESLSHYSRGELAKQISMLIPGYIGAEYMSAFEVAAEGRHPYTPGSGRLRREDVVAVENAFRTLHIFSLGKEYFRTLSDGQKRLVMLARILAQDTPVMVLDEPETHLDIKYRLEVFSLLRSLADEKNRTIIISLHDISSAKLLADELLCIRSDHTYFAGRKQDILCGDTIEKLFEVDRKRLYGDFKEVPII